MGHSRKLKSAIGSILHNVDGMIVGRLLRIVWRMDQNTKSSALISSIRVPCIVRFYQPRQRFSPDMAPTLRELWPGLDLRRVDAACGKELELSFAVLRRARLSVVVVAGRVTVD